MLSGMSDMLNIPHVGNLAYSARARQAGVCFPKARPRKIPLDYFELIN
jgi:hypothetical protein